jgi:hypothetical protein
MELLMEKESVLLAETVIMKAKSSKIPMMVNVSSNLKMEILIKAEFAIICSKVLVNIIFHLKNSHMLDSGI